MAYMVCKDPADPENGNAVVFNAGQLDIYNKIDGVRTTTPTTPLKKYKAGSAPIGSWTELPGYWTETPQVLVSAKKIPTYYARGRLGQQRFTLSCEVQSAGTALKFRIRPILTFYIGSGGSGTETVNEEVPTDVDWNGNETVNFVGKSTTPRFGAGTLSVSISWQTRARSFYIRLHHNEAYRWSTNSQIYVDKFKVMSNGAISIESQQLVSESGTAYGQEVQTQTFTGINLGNDTCSWVIRKETQTASRDTADGGPDADIVNLLRLNSYSYTTSAETLTNPTGEVFYLAIGR